MITSINSCLFPGFENFKQVGRGAYGIVYTAQNTKTGQHIALKTVDKINLMTEANRSVFRHELSVYSKICHPFLTQYYATLEDQAGVYTAIEYIDNGTLLSYITQHSRLRESDCAKIFCELISAVKYLHEDKQIIHRDIKAENILIDNQMNIRLIDFGLSEFMKNGTETFDIKCGTFPYSAPEMLKGQKYTKSIDIWSCGIVLYIMLTGTFPFIGNSQRELYQQIVFQEPQFPPYLSPLAKDLLSSLLAKNPENRITIREITAHPWIVGCRQCAFLSNDFATKSMESINPQRKEDINCNVVNLLSSYKVDTTTIVDDLLEGKFTEATTLYKIYAKQEVMKGMQSPEEIRTMYGIRRKMSTLNCCKRRSESTQKSGSIKSDSGKIGVFRSTDSMTSHLRKKKLRNSCSIMKLSIDIKSNESLPSLSPLTKAYNPFV